jgi:uncharacterized protein
VSEILKALYRGDAATARELARGAPLDVFEAAALGETARVRQLVDDATALANAFGADGFHPTRLACFFGHVDSAHVLLEHGAEVDALSRNEHVQTAAIHAAAASGETGADDATRQGLSRQGTGTDLRLSRDPA